MGGITARITASWVRWRGSSPALPRLVPERAGEAVMQASAVQVWPIHTTKRRMESVTTFIHHRSITGNRPPYCLHGRFFLFRECPCCLSSPTAHFRTCTHRACALMRGKIESRAVFADIDVGGPEASASQWRCCEPCMAPHHPLPRKCSGTSLDSHVVPETCRHSPPPNRREPSPRTHTPCAGAAARHTAYGHSHILLHARPAPSLFVPCAVCLAPAHCVCTVARGGLFMYHLCIVFCIVISCAT